MRIAGAVLIFFGFLFFIGTVRIPFGLALMFIGILLAIFGGRRKEAITDDLELIITLAPKQGHPPPSDAPARAPEIRQDAIKDVFAAGISFVIRLAEGSAKAGARAVNVILDALNKIHLFRSAVRGVDHEQPRNDRAKSQYEPRVLVPSVDLVPRQEPTFDSRIAIDAFDRREWQALLKYDRELAQIATKLSGLGDKWVDELARSYLAKNDKAHLPDIITQIIADARKERGVA